MRIPPSPVGIRNARKAMQKRMIPAIFRPGIDGDTMTGGVSTFSWGSAPVTSSSSVTRKSWLSFISLSRSGTLESVSHLLTDWRLTSSTSARSP